ncbi:MAG: VOC family protein, partial [Actinomycetales bacterium]|nr:VOC family protein [Actinomycetales bacterium]
LRRDSTAHRQMSDLMMNGDSELIRLALPGLATAPKIGQIGILVPDLAPAIRQWSAVMGSENWLVFTYDSEALPNMTYRGRPGAFAMRVALLGRDPQIELIESLRGPNIYDDWLADHGYGTHHLGFYVESITATMKSLGDLGIAVLQSGMGYGLNGDGGFAYLDTEDVLGVILEAIEIPSVRRPSEPIPR